MSLISVMQTLTFQHFNDAGGAIPPDAIVPHRWAIGTIWLRLEGDSDKTYEQQIELVAPDGTRFGTTLMPFKMTHRTHNLVLNGQGFPVGQAGEYEFQLSLREVGVDADWQQIAQYPVEIVHAGQALQSVETESSHRSDR